MILNATNIQAAFVAHKALFMKGMKLVEANYKAFASLVPSQGTSNHYHFGGGIPGMREWKDKRLVNPLNLRDVELKNLTYELTVGIERDAYEDDNLGVYNDQIQMMGLQAAAHPDELLVDLLNGSFAGLCYDGKAFCATNHPRLVDKGTQSNKGTAALAADSFEAAITALRKLTDEHSKNLRLIRKGVTLTLVVPSALEATAREILMAERLASGATNTNYGRAEILVLDDLTSDTAWWLCINGLPIKPMIYQTRRAPAFTALTKLDDENVFMNKTFLYGVDGRWAMGYGFWQTTYGSDGST